MLSYCRAIGWAIGKVWSLGLTVRSGRLGYPKAQDPQSIAMLDSIIELDQSVQNRHLVDSWSLMDWVLGIGLTVIKSGTVVSSWSRWIVHSRKRSSHLSPSIV